MPTLLACELLLVKNSATDQFGEFKLYSAEAVKEGLVLKCCSPILCVSVLIALWVRKSLRPNLWIPTWTI